MEKEKNYTSIIIIFGIIIFVILVGVYYIGKSSNNSPLENSQPQNNQTTAEVQTQSPQSKCDTVAKNYFNTYKPTETKSLKTVNLSYQNYYNQSNNSCYVLVSYNFNMADNSDGSSSLKLTYTLVDVYKKSITGEGYEVLGSYSQSISAVDAIMNRLDDCNVAGRQCYSLSSFLSLANPYIGK